MNNELHAVDIQIQELLERQQELTQKKNILTNRIKQCLEDSDAGGSNECDSSPASWNKEGLLFLSFFFSPFAGFFLLVSSNWSQITVPGAVLSSELRGETCYSLSGMGNLIGRPFIILVL